MSGENKEMVSQGDIERMFQEQEEKYKKLLALKDEQINSLHNLLKEKEEKLEKAKELLEQTALTLELTETDILILRKIIKEQEEQISVLKDKNSIKNDELVLSNQKFIDELQQKLSMLSVGSPSENVSNLNSTNISRSTSFLSDSPVLASNHEPEAQNDKECASSNVNQ